MEKGTALLVLQQMYFDHFYDEGQQVGQVQKAKAEKLVCERLQMYSAVKEVKKRMQAVLEEKQKKAKVHF